MTKVICYRTKEDIVKYGTNIGRDFLMIYFFGTKEEAQKIVDETNTNKPAVFCNGEKIDWNKVDFFYVEEQEEYD